VKNTELRSLATDVFQLTFTTMLSAVDLFLIFDFLIFWHRICREVSVAKINGNQWFAFQENVRFSSFLFMHSKRFSTQYIIRCACVIETICYAW